MGWTDPAAHNFQQNETATAAVLNQFFVNNLQALQGSIQCWRANPAAIPTAPMAGVAPPCNAPNYRCYFGIGSATGDSAGNFSPTMYGACFPTNIAVVIPFVLFNGGLVDFGIAVRNGNPCGWGGTLVRQSNTSLNVGNAFFGFVFYAVGF